jgi:hypothetical protein
MVENAKKGQTAPPASEKATETHTVSRRQGGITLGEVRTLVDYAIRQGLDPEGKIVQPLEGALDATTDSVEDDRAPPDILVLYGKLCRLATPVTGRSLGDTGVMRRYVLWIAIYSGVFLVAALANEALGTALADYAEAEEGWQVGALVLHLYVLDPITPFLWGALGSCVYLLKRLTDLAAEGQFDRFKLQGWKTRVLLGAILGGIMQYVYDPASFTEPGLRLDANAVAFLAGIGVRVVYGAIERTVALLGQKLNLDALRRERGRSSPVVGFLTEELAKVDPEKEPERRKMLQALLNKASTPTST